MTVSSRVTLVTGGARRVGAAIVRACAARGDRLIIHASSSVEEAEMLASELRVMGTHVAVLEADLCEPDAPATLIEQSVAVFGRLDVLVNSAANFVQAELMDITPMQWDAAYALNVRAPFFAAQAAARHMTDGGVVINIADHLAFETMPVMVAHASAKSALVHVTRTLARALAPKIRVNAVVPGLVAAPPDWTEEDVTSFLRSVPLARAGSMDDVAHAVAWLIDASYVTGAIVPVDGGRGVAR